MTQKVDKEENWDKFAKMYPSDAETIQIRSCLSEEHKKAWKKWQDFKEKTS